MSKKKNIKRRQAKQESHRHNRLPGKSANAKIQRLIEAGRSADKYLIIIIFFMPIWAFLLYSKSLGGPFIFDDEPNIALNNAIRIDGLSLAKIGEAAFAGPLSTRPVAYLSFALNYYIHGYEVWGYRVVNVLIHILNSFLLYFLFKITFKTPALAGRYGAPREISIVAALLFLVHPVAVQSVAYVVQRMTSLAALFFIISLLLYAKARLAQKHQILLFTGSLVAALLALGSKEIAAILPMIILLYEWYFFQDLKLEQAKKRIGWLITGLLAFGVIVFVFLGSDPVSRVLSGYAHRDFSLEERLLTELRVVVYYLSLLVFPHPDRLNLDYDFSLSTSLLTPVSTLLALLALIGLVGAALYTARRYRLLSFAILWYLGNLVIESSIIPLEIIFEHRTYLPFAMLFLLFAVLLAQSLRDRRWRLTAVGFIVLIFSFWTYQRAMVWGDDIALWSDVTAKAPGEPRGHHNLGTALRDRKRLNEAISHFEEAIRLDPKYFKGQQNLGDALLRTGQIKRALTHFTKAAELEPDNPAVHLGLGRSLSELGRRQEAIDAFREVIRLEPDNRFVHDDLGFELAAMGQVNEAIMHFEKAIELDREIVSDRRNLAVVLFNNGQVEKAVKLLEEAMRLSPSDAGIQKDLGLALLEAGKKNEAIAVLRNALRLNPEMAEARLLLQRAEAGQE